MLLGVLHWQQLCISFNLGVRHSLIRALMYARPSKNGKDNDLFS